MNRTGIEWCDYTWNPIVGCSPTSAGCANCYAAAISLRFGLPWGKPVFRPDRLDQVGRVKKPGRVFVCSMSDLGHPDVRPEWRDRIVRYMMVNQQHEYIVLTKRPGPWMRAFGLYAWLGVTVENQEEAERRIPVLLGIDNTDRWFVSVEPMLEAVNLSIAAFTGSESVSRLGGLKWVIAGPETGPKARPCRPEWIEAVAHECEVGGVPFFDKRGILRREFPDRRA
jgi:protein gp37